MVAWTVWRWADINIIFQFYSSHVDFEQYQTDRLQLQEFELRITLALFLFLFLFLTKKQNYQHRGPSFRLLVDQRVLVRTFRS